MTNSQPKIADAIPSPEPAASASKTSTTTPVPLNQWRAFISSAKIKKKHYWYIEMAAAIMSVVTSLLPWAQIAAAAGIISLILKVAGKIKLSASKRLFRAGERARRYEFYSTALGWPIPPKERADMALAKAPALSKTLETNLRKTEAEYYSRKGPPSIDRLFQNLAESMFWTEKLMGIMAKTRQGNLFWAICALLLALAGTVIIHPPEAPLLILKSIGAFVTLLVAVDVWGEAQSFQRGETETERLLATLLAENRQPKPSRDEAIRILIEYNCLLADLPILPDEVYFKNRDSLTDAWRKLAAPTPNQQVSEPVVPQ